MTLVRRGLASSMAVVTVVPCVCLALVAIVWQATGQVSSVHQLAAHAGQRLADAWATFPESREVIAFLAQAQGFRLGVAGEPHGDALVVEAGGGVAFVHDLTTEHSIVRETVIELIVMILFSVLWVVGTALWMGMRWIRAPIDTLVSQAQRIAQGDFAATGPRDGPVEVMRLSRALTVMAAALERAKLQASEAEQARLAEQRRFMQVERLATVGRLAAGFTHELGTPLNIVLLEAEAIREGEEPVEHANTILDQVERLRGLTRSLLQLCASHGPRSLQRQTALANVEQVAQESVRMLGSIARKDGVSLSTQTEAARVAVAPAELTQVVVNLVVNAIHAVVSRPGDAPRVVKVSTRRALRDGQAWVVIEVQDNGPGIAKADRDRLCDPFFTTKDPGQGTGLGLAIVHAIATDAQGTITFPDDDDGATVRVELPEADPPPA